MQKFFLLLLLLPVLASAQTKEITLEDVYKKGTFRGEFVPASFDETKKEAENKPDDLKDETGKSQLVHTLNGSSLALPRIIACLLENNQTAAGIKIPGAIHAYFKDSILS